MSRSSSSYIVGSGIRDSRPRHLTEETHPGNLRAETCVDCVVGERHEWCQGAGGLGWCGKLGTLHFCSGGRATPVKDVIHCPVEQSTAYSGGGDSSVHVFAIPAVLVTLLVMIGVCGWFQHFSIVKSQSIGKNSRSTKSNIEKTVAPTHITKLGGSDATEVEIQEASTSGYELGTL